MQKGTFYGPIAIRMNAVANESKPAVKLGKSGKKICCSCPDTKSVRDLCLVENGEEKCAAVIEAHKQCLRSEGFTVK